MNELLSRNNQIAAYIDSLGSSIPGEEQQSVLLSMGGLTGGGDNSVTNCGTNCLDCINTKNCKNMTNGGSCGNYNNACEGSVNGGNCINTKNSYKPSTNKSWSSCA